jgi:formate dehydrogenase subunit beta
MKKAIWVEGPVKKGVLNFLNGLLADQKIKAVLMPAKNKRGDSYAWFLMGKDGLLKTADPAPPVMTTQGANVVSYLTRKGPVWEKTAVLLRPCEYRAVIELAKIKQVDLTRLVVVSFDCPGAYPLENYIKGDQKKLDEVFSACLENQTALEGTRNACAICHRFTGTGADIEIGIMGGEGKGFWIVAGSKQGEELLEGIPGSEADHLDARGKTISERTRERETRRNATLDSFQEAVSGPENLLNTLAACINCHNCSRVCPICVCRECYFDSKALRSEADNMLLRARRKGGLRLPPDLLLFHLGRMTHMSVSCVSCGACEDACPANVPVSMLFALAGRNTQAVFDYEPGRSLDEALPYKVFKFEELKNFEIPYTKEYAKA